MRPTRTPLDPTLMCWLRLRYIGRCHHCCADMSRGDKALFVRHGVVLCVPCGRAAEVRVARDDERRRELRARTYASPPRE